MHIKSLIATGATAALLVTPAWALAAGPPANPGGDHPTGQSNPGSADKPSTPGPSASPKAKARAYGKYCQTQSKKHVAGQKGTPFSQCVTAMAKLATGKVKNPTTACKTLSKKHVAGQKGTPFSQCVSAAAKLHRDEADSGETTPTGDGTTTTS